MVGVTLLWPLMISHSLHTLFVNIMCYHGLNVDIFEKYSNLMLRCVHLCMKCTSGSVKQLFFIIQREFCVAFYGVCCNVRREKKEILWECKEKHVFFSPLVMRHSKKKILGFL